MQKFLEDTDSPGGCTLESWAGRGWWWGRDSEHPSAWVHPTPRDSDCICQDAAWTPGFLRAAQVIVMCIKV